MVPYFVYQFVLLEIKLIMQIDQSLINGCPRYAWGGDLGGELVVIICDMGGGWSSNL